jgi:putative SbcD/Mre11-related phosphoesterase
MPDTALGCRRRPADVQPWIEVGSGICVTGSGAAWLPAHGTVVVADVHVGYELAAQRRGGWLPPLASGAELGARLVALAAALGATRLVIAGDLRHSTRDVDAFERAELAALVTAVQAHVRLDLVLGNHDRGGALVDVPAATLVQVGDVSIVHQPPAVTPAGWTIAGHLHPRITLRDETGAASRFPCALVGERTVVIPAFSEWAGGTEARRLLPALAPGRWRALPLTGGEIADLGLVIGAEPGLAGAEWEPPPRP